MNAVELLAYLGLGYWPGYRVNWAVIAPTGAAQRKGHRLRFGLPLMMVT